MGFPGGSVVKNPPADTGDADSIPGSGRSPGERNGNPLQYSCLKNPMDRGAWWATVHGAQRVGHDPATEQQQIAQFQQPLFFHLYPHSLLPLPYYFAGNHIT